MRAFARSLTLCLAFVSGLLPSQAVTQDSGANSTQTGRPDSDQNALNPLIQGIFETIINDAIRNPDTPQPPPRDDVQPTQPTQPTQPQRPQVTDRTGPVIEPLRPEFTGDRGRARIEARITDQSGVAAASVRVGETRVGMGAAGQAVYGATLRLPQHYRPVAVTIEARDIHGNRARPVEVALRRVAACGVLGGETLPLARSVQSSLQTLGFYGGSIDGLAGPNTCGALGEAGIAEPFSWPEIARVLEARVELERISDVPPAIPRYLPVPPATLLPDNPPARVGPIVPPGLVPFPVFPEPGGAEPLPEVDTTIAERPRKPWPEWATPQMIGILGAFVLVTVGGVLFRRAGRRAEAGTGGAAPALRLVAVPDPSPEVVHDGPGMPGLVLVVDPGPAARAEIQYDEKVEEAAQ